MCVTTATALSQVWLFIVAPLVGGIAAGGCAGSSIHGPDRSPHPDRMH